MRQFSTERQRRAGQQRAKQFSRQHRRLRRQISSNYLLQGRRFQGRRFRPVSDALPINLRRQREG